MHKTVIETEQRLHHLLVIKDTQGWRPVFLEAATYSIGRDLTNSIVLYSKLVSRQHSILLRVTAPETTNYLFRIIDGNLQGKRSTNGLRINGRCCFSHDLKHGDSIVFAGGVKAKYYAISELSDLEFLKSGAVEDPSGFLSSLNNPRQILVASDSEYENFGEAALVRLASFPKLIPNSILEVDLTGTITYLNPAAVTQFSDIQAAGLQHPILVGLLSMVQQGPGQGHPVRTFFAREVEIGNQVFDQSIHYIPESDLNEASPLQAAEYQHQKRGSCSSLCSFRYSLSWSLT